MSILVSSPTRWIIVPVCWFALGTCHGGTTFPAYTQQCADDAGPPFADDDATFGEGGKYHDGSSAIPVLMENGECAPRMQMACAFHQQGTTTDNNNANAQAKAAYIEGPIDCGDTGWYCRILADPNVPPINLIGDLNFGYCNTTEGQEDAGYDRSGHCHGSSDDSTYYWWMRDHWFRQYNGRLRCCCGWYNSNDSSGIQPAMVEGKITNRCDYRRLVVDETDANSCRDANEGHGLTYEGGCKEGTTPINTPLVENDEQCWELLNFGYVENGGGNDDGGDNGDDEEEEPTWNLIVENDFENDWGSFRRGGNDARRWSKGGGRTKGGIGSLFIRDNSGIKSSIYTDEIDVSSYRKVKVTFWYKVFNFEAGEDFMLDVKYDDERWFIKSKFVYETHFTSLKKWFKGIKQVNTEDIDTMRLRFRCDASSNRDKVFIDDVTIEGWG